MSLRPRLFGIAYRMLSSASEAEDLVQEVWLRWQKTDRSAVASPAAFLATAMTRMAINALDSARVRRERYIGPWLPEPVDTSADPYLGAERGEALEFAALLLMEKLTPNERAAYVLREAFDYPYGQIADILQMTEPAVRQLVSRARKHMTSERRTPVSAAAQRELLTSFIAAARTGGRHRARDEVPVCHRRVVLGRHGRAVGERQRPDFRRDRAERQRVRGSDGHRLNGGHRPLAVDRQPGEDRRHRRGGLNRRSHDSVRYLLIRPPPLTRVPRPAHRG
jgi:RNA polymerase sigma factor (sigma-70 family)